MDTLIGITGKDFVALACDQTSHFSLIRLKHDSDKILEMDSNKLLATAGEVGDANQFGEYIRKNVHLYRFRNSLELGTHATAHFTRRQLAYFLRKNPYMVDLLLAGVDRDGPVLYWMDYLASMVSTNKVVQGRGASFVYGILDEYYHPEMSEDEVLEVIKMCALEMKKRFIVAHYNFLVKIVDKNGVRKFNVNV